MTQSSRPPLALWGGVECTVSRVQDVWSDQVVRTGHHDRISDLDLFADLGLEALRYPLLWERIAPNSPEHRDWRWTDARMARFRELEMRPIAGLLHHGSGPKYTNLLDDAFPELFADFALDVARRYPWIECYAPINEILTTARFSGLYGHWYPHGHEQGAFLRILLNQCRASILAMRAIRSVVPHAQFFLIEDLGKTHATDRLAYQAEHENQRRWASHDLICGHVGPEHPLWKHFRGVGIREDTLNWFRENRCPPDVLGCNYYVTSERFLDHRLHLYPAELVGGNERERYVDTEAVRALRRGGVGPKCLLREAWARYRIPLALTEVHLCCTPNEQIRWFHGLYNVCEALRAEGVDLRAITSWSLLGAFDWNSLLTRNAGFYESGAFRVVNGRPEPTPLAEVLRALGSNRTYHHPLLEKQGWWLRPERLFDHAAESA